MNAREEGWKVVVATLNAAGGTIPPTFESLADAVSRFELRGGDASRTGTGSPLPSLRSY